MLPRALDFVPMRPSTYVDFDRLQPMQDENRHCYRTAVIMGDSNSLFFEFTLKSSKKQCLTAK